MLYLLLHLVRISSPQRQNRETFNEDCPPNTSARVLYDVNCQVRPNTIQALLRLNIGADFPFIHSDDNNERHHHPFRSDPASLLRAQCSAASPVAVVRLIVDALLPNKIVRVA